MAAPAELLGFRIGAELSGTARATVHLATAGSSPALHAVKIYTTDQPPGPRRAALLLAFRAATEAQMAAHAKAPSRWAAVRATGDIPASAKNKNPRAACLVTDYYPRTLARVVDARLALDLRAIYALTGGVIEALAALDAAASRAHGALAPGNIFIDGSGPLRKSRIVLTEPAPLSGVTPEQARAADNRGLGTLIATLIRRRPHTGWPIEDGPEWTALGKHRQAWLDFCNYLLTPSPSASDTTVTELRRRFARLGGRGMSTRTKILIPAAALVVLASPFAALRFAPFEKIPESLQEFAIKLGNLPPDVEEIPAEFAQLCDIWYEWFGGLCAETESPQNGARWAADPWLREHVLALTAPSARAALDPRVLTKDDRNFENLLANPPETAKQGLVVRRIKQAHATLKTLSESFASWPGAATLAQTAQKLDAIGLKTAAEELRAPEFAHLPSINSGRLPANISLRLRMLESAAAAERAWAATAQKLDTLDATTDPVLRGLRPREVQAVASAPVSGVAARLAETAPALDARVTFVKADWAERIGRQRWLTESFVRAHTGPATDADLARWDTEIRDYYIIDPADDPRRAPALDSAVTTAATALRNLAGEESNLAAGNAVSAPLVSQQAALDADLKAFRAGQVLVKDIPAAREKTAALQNRYAGLAQKVAAALDELHPDPAEWLGRIRNATAGDSPALNAEWSRRRDELLRDITPERLRANDAAFRDLRSRVRQTREFLTGLEGPDYAGAIKPLNLPAHISEPIAAQTRAADAAQKDALLADLLSQTQWSADSTPSLAQTAATRARIEQLNAWRESATGVAENLTRLETLLALGSTWGESTALAGGPFEIAGINTQIAAAPAAPSITSAGVPAALAAALARLASLQTATDRAALLAASAEAGAPLSIAFTAWQRLDALPDWPATIDELNSEASIEKALIARFEAVQKLQTQPAAGVAAKLETIKAAAPLRWRRGYAQIPVEHTAEVIALMPRFGVKPEDLTGLDRFDYLLAQAKQIRWARLGETAARDQRNAFAADARAALAQIPDAAPAAILALKSDTLPRFLSAAGAINLEPTGQPTTPADIGPGRIGWTGEFSDDMRAATYRWTDLRGTAHTQKYLLVEPEAGVPFFLSTTAVSVGEFISLIESKPEGRDVIAVMPSWIADVSGGTDTDFRPGPQTWRILAPRRTTPTRLNDSRMALNTRWQAFLDPRWPTPYYTPGITEPKPPSADSPMQNLPPAAARVFAERILGARLATPEEWSGIVELYAAQSARPDSPGANFSDSTWIAQRDYLVQNGSLFEHPWPDSGAYLPPGQPPATAQSHATAEPYAPQASDGSLWFADVGSSPQPDGFSHLFGNVATFLYDPLAPAASRYSVAGASAISPAIIDPKKIYPVSSDSEGYADIGLRPAFDASKAMILRGQLMQLLRKQPYVRQQKP